MSLARLFICAASLTAAACDGGIEVEGNVTDASGVPIGDARIYLADRVFDEDLDAFLEGTSEVPYYEKTNGQGSSDPDGFYSVIRIVGGVGDHDFWLLVYKDGFETHTEQIWKNDGHPDFDAQPFIADVVLQPTTE